MIPREILKKIRQIEIRTNRTVASPARSLGLFLILSLFCSCAMENSEHIRRPLAAPFNHDAGRGSLLSVTLRLESGEALPLIVDTGTSVTCLDASLEDKLGEPLGTTTVRQWGKLEKKNVYATPKLYLGNTTLKTAGQITTMEFRSLSAQMKRPLMGILGMDVLRHYCIQLDFAAHEMRFLDSKQANKKDWGKAFRIVPLHPNDERPAIAQNLFGAQGPHSLIDSGYDTDGWLMPIYFQQWTNRATLPAKGEIRSPDGLFGGETYSNVSLRNVNVRSDGIGLNFLARHLVTLDFPNHTMYLKRTSVDPLVSEITKTPTDGAIRSHH
jgi:hypothetical protein